MIICPVCHAPISRITPAHAKMHGLTVLGWHTLRLEREFKRPIADILHDAYVVERLSSPQIFARYGLTYRALRRLLAQHGIPMRDMSEAIAASWEKDDGTRSVATAEKRRETSRLYYARGGISPSKRPEVARKISIAKRKRNPGLMPMLLGNRQRRLSNPSPLEVAMRSALDAAGILYEVEYRVGRYFLDIAIPQILVGIECDGRGWHDTDPMHQIRRDAWLEGKGWRIIRYRQGAIQASAADCVTDFLARLQEFGLEPPLRCK